MKLTSFFILFLALTVHAFGDDRPETSPKRRTAQTICEPSQFGLQDYYGYRIQHQIIYGYPPLHHTRVSFCKGGTAVGMDAYYPQYSYEDIMWGKKMCTNQPIENRNHCFIIARRKDYAYRNISYYSHHDWVGGLFICPGHSEEDGIECDNTNAIPLLPLIADDYIFAWTQLIDQRLFVHRIPLIQTLDYEPITSPIVQYPIPMDWYKQINVREEYDYSSDERDMIRKAMDLFYNVYFLASNEDFGIVPNDDIAYTDHGDGTPRRFTRREVLASLPRIDTSHFYNALSKMNSQQHEKFAADTAEIFARVNLNATNEWEFLPYKNYTKFIEENF